MHNRNINPNKKRRKNAERSPQRKMVRAQRAMGMLVKKASTDNKQIQDLKIKVANRYFYPDASIVCGKAVFTDDMNDVVLNPTVLFEILSPSSAAYDRGVKFLSYQGIESLREYVLISQDEEIVETYRRHLESSWLYSRAEAELHLDSVGVKVRVCDLYED